MVRLVGCVERTDPNARWWEMSEKDENLSEVGSGHRLEDLSVHNLFQEVQERHGTILGH